MADNDRENEEQQPGEVRIMDLRHSRDAGAEEEESSADEKAVPTEVDADKAEAEQPSAPELVADTVAPEPAAAAAAPEAPGAPAPPQFEVVGGNDEPEPPVTANVTPPEGDEYYDEELPAEMEQLRQVFGVGIAGYLRGQISLMANFALIYLGRTPNPASGIVTREMEKARISIDMLEFVASRIAGDLNEQERREVGSLISELKYMYMQGLGEPGAGVPPVAPG